MEHMAYRSWGEPGHGHLTFSPPHLLSPVFWFLISGCELCPQASGGSNI